MGLRNWFQKALGSGNDKTVQQLQREVVLQEERFQSIYKSLRQLAARQAELLERLRQAKNEDEARLISQSLVSLDLEDKHLRSEWARVERELTDLRSSIAIASTTATADQVRQRQRLLERTEGLMRERAVAEDALQQAGQTARMTTEAAQESVQKAREATGAMASGTESYVALWRQSRQPTSPESRPKEPPSPA